MSLYNHTDQIKKLLQFSFPCNFLKAFFVCFSFAAFTSCQKDFKNIQAGAAQSDDMGQAASNKPNIVIILADDIGYEVPTVNGGQSYTTPKIDKMAVDGMRFTQAEGLPSCSPSRIQFITGKYNFRNYIEWAVVKPGEKTIANMLKGAGYDTYVAGKWQFDGGDTGVHNFGFDEYVIFDEWAKVGGHGDDENGTKGRFKNPELLSNGSYLPASSVLGKYCDDILVDSVLSYAAKSKAKRKPFLIYYSMSLAHSPFSPTPDDPEFATWDPLLEISDPKYFPSMVAYMDKKVGQVINGIDRISSNTIYIYFGDNGTPHEISSMFNGQLIQGGKQKTITTGIHVPFIVRWKGRIAAGSINNNIIDFSDILPTVADMAGIARPRTYGTLDGISFYPQLLGQPSTPRSWYFGHFDPEHSVTKPVTRWISDGTYKLYDSSNKFFNITTDFYEKSKIKEEDRTVAEQALNIYFQSILDTLH